MREEIQAIKKAMKEMCRRLEQLEKMQNEREKKARETEKKTEEKLSYLETLKKGLPKGNSVTIQQVADIQERHMNVIVRGVQELESEDRQERQHHDRKRIRKVAEIAGIDKNEFSNSIISFHRLGKYEQERQHRPILVKLGDQQIRQQALRSNKWLREHNQKEGTRFRFDADLTPEQRTNLNNLWDKAREKTEKSKNGTKFFVIGFENPQLRSSRPAEDQE